MKIGEGGIAVFNLTHAWMATHDIVATFLCFALSLFCLSVLYGFNDFTDRKNDQHNPKKDQHFVQQILNQPKLMLSVNLTASMALLLFVYFQFGALQGIYALLLLLINAAYSLGLKKTAGADIFIVIVWGGVFTLITPSVSYPLAAIAGLMTGIAHVFQMITDETTDKKNEVHTTIVQFPSSKNFILLLLSVLSGVSIYIIADWKVALSCFIPLLIFMASKNVNWSWIASRIYFVCMWMVLLTKLYAA